MKKILLLSCLGLLVINTTAHAVSLTGSSCSFGRSAIPTVINITTGSGSNDSDVLLYSGVSNQGCIVSDATPAQISMINTAVSNARAEGLRFSISIPQTSIPNTFESLSVIVNKPAI